MACFEMLSFRQGPTCAHLPTEYNFNEKDRERLITLHFRLLLTHLLFFNPSSLVEKKIVFFLPRNSFLISIIYKYSFRWAGEFIVQIKHFRTNFLSQEFFLMHSKFNNRKNFATAFGKILINFSPKFFLASVLLVCGNNYHWISVIEILGKYIEPELQLKMHGIFFLTLIITQ